MSSNAHYRTKLSVYRSVAMLLLLFNGIGALYGGGSLMLHPDGSGLYMSTTLLSHTPFSDFLIPGIVLFVVNGLFSLMVLLLAATHNKAYEWYITAQGVLLLGWLGVQILLIRTLDIMHVVMGVTGVGLAVCGFMLGRLNRIAQEQM